MPRRRARDGKGGTLPPSTEEIVAFQVATRDLIDVAVRSVEVVAPEVSLPQFRLLLALAEFGRIPSTRLAYELGVAASSVTRMVDRLVTSGHVMRSRDDENRSLVLLALSPLGSRTVTEVLTWRHLELARLLQAVDPEDRAVAARALGAFHASADRNPEHSHLGWLPL